MIDGITVDFQLANETEAVANMQNYFHEYRALFVADNCIGTMHNIYTIRGAKVRDAKIWARVLTDAYYRYGDKAEVIFQGHAWPHWNTQDHPDAVKEVLLYHAAAYQFTHDQSLLLMGQGETPNEIAAHLSVPEKIARKWYLRPYYGDFRVNARAIYHKYLGFYDANPVHLFPLTEEEEAKKFIEYVGSAEKVLEKAEQDFEAGNYQYAAQAANAVVFADPDNEHARYLCADALEQLGYQSESGIFRNAYLTGAKELREKKPELLGDKKGPNTILYEMSNEHLLDYLGMVVDSSRIEQLEEEFVLDIGGEEKYLVVVISGTILKKRISEGEQLPEAAQGNIRKITREQLIFLIEKNEASQTASGEIFADPFWKQIADAVTDLREHISFSITEP